ncbi:hypothetical protein BDZ91DRAFT_786934 [Kalaharituber pfeilii]|nr:hypothetical protein BDZ91DRAFT_786934 [Kalaharituber pfeilii]
MPSQSKIVVGIDFGTTYSGVAWAYSIKPDEIQTIRQWPGATGGQDVDKVPSEMAYLPEDVFKWGFQTSGYKIQQPDKVLQYVKLLLDPSQEQNSDVRDPLRLDKTRAALPEGKKPVDAVTDYLRAVKAHTLEVLGHVFGSKFWENIDIEYHVTIPAVWSESAKALTLKAATDAGICSDKDIVLITEPEAASLHCLTDLYSGLLKAGDTFVVVDCGGGTVDLISYEIQQREPKLEVKEVAVGGKLCGSVFLNKEFEKFIRKRLGEETVKKMKQKGRPYCLMMKEFDENLKRLFNEEQDFMYCPVPGVANDQKNRIQDSFLEISKTEMKAIFDPVIAQVLDLIKEQLDSVSLKGRKPVSCILLVGGFGSSKYLRKRVEDYITSTSATPDIKVIQPINAWSAVARGAVLCGLQIVKIRSRQARRNYGVGFRSPFINEKHDEVDRTWCSIEEKYFCANQMQWYVKKGDEIADMQKISFPFYLTFSSKDTNLCSKQILRASDSAAATVENRSTDRNVYEVCSITCDLNPLRSHLNERRTLNDKLYYTLDFTLVMRIHSGQLTFAFEYGDVTYKEITVKFF